MDNPGHGALAESARHGIPAAVEDDRVVLARQWLGHFGAEDVQQLDLGMLAAIADCIRDRVPPPAG